MLIMSVTRKIDDEIDSVGFTARNLEFSGLSIGSGGCGGRQCRDGSKQSRQNSSTTESTMVSQTVREVYHTVDLHGLRRLGVDAGSCGHRSVIVLSYRNT